MEKKPRKHATHRAFYDTKQKCYYPQYWDERKHWWHTYRSVDGYIHHGTKEECKSWLHDAKISEKQAGII